VACIKLDDIYSLKLNMILIHCVDLVSAKIVWMPHVKISLKAFHLDKSKCGTAKHTTTTRAGFSRVLGIKLRQAIVETIV